MQSTTMTLQRSRVTIRSGIPVQIENMAWRVAADLGGQSPYDSYWIYATGGGSLDVRRGDLLIDERTVDPLTAQSTQYRIFGNPEDFDTSHTEIPAEKLLGQ